MITRTTVLLEVVPADGAAAWVTPQVRKFQSTPPWTFGASAPGTIPIRIRHDGPTAGYIDYLEHGLGYGNGALFGVGVVENVDADYIDGRVQCSAEIRANAMAYNVDTVEHEAFTPYSFTGPKGVQYRMRPTAKSVGSMNATEATLHAVALVDETASLTSFRCRAWDGDYRSPADRGRWIMRDIPDPVLRAIKAAETTSLRYSRPSSIRIHQPADSDHLGQYRHGGRPEIVIHGGGRILDVRSA